MGYVNEFIVTLTHKHLAFCMDRSGMTGRENAVRGTCNYQSPSQSVYCWQSRHDHTSHA